MLCCPACGSYDIDVHEAGGHSACVSCGTLVEENTIVSSIEFQESGERSHVVGQYVSATSSKPYSSISKGRGRYGNSRESRETTLSQARKAIEMLVSQLGCPKWYVDRAFRLYQMALSKNFVFGRKQTHVIATCLYTVCREQKSHLLLIDFSDQLHVNVFVLGCAFLRFIRMIDLPTALPTVDPSLYIHRFAKKLELGPKFEDIVSTSLRLITRFKKDWLTEGRRPDGICAGATLIACRCHGVHKTQLEISKLFRVSSQTLKERLDEFKATPSAQLTLEQFNAANFSPELTNASVEFDPPSYIRNLARGSMVVLGDNGNVIDDYASWPHIEGGDFAEETRSHMYVTSIGGVEITLPVGANYQKTKKVSDHQLLKMGAREVLYDEITADLSASAIASSSSYEEPSGNISAVIEGISREDTVPIDFDEVLLSMAPSSQGQNRAIASSSSAAAKPDEVLLAPVLDKLPNYYNANDVDIEFDQQYIANVINETNMDLYILPENEQKKKAQIWESAYREFIEERKNKKSSQKVALAGRLQQQQPERERKKRPRGTRSGAGDADDDVHDEPYVKKTSKKINYGAFDKANVTVAL